MITPVYAPTATERVLPRMALDFTTGVLDPRVTVSRALNTATRVNSSGVIEIVNENLPRFDYNPATLTPKGLLVEETRTNLFLNSLINGTSLSTQIVAVTAVPHTISFYGTGTITLSGAATATVTGAGTYPNRISLTFTPLVGALTCTVTGSVQYAQIEVGAFITSFIPTAATSQTRNADAVSMTGTNFSDWYNASQGTLSVVADSGNVPNADSTVRMAAAITDVISFTNAVRLERLSGQYRAVTTVSGAANLVTGTWGTNTVGTLVSAYGVNAVAAFNGAAAQPFAQTAPVAPLFLGIGSNGLDANFFCGHIKSIRYFPQRLLNAETQAFSK